MLRELHALLTSISSAETLSELLQLVAQGVVDVLGFQIAAVNYLDDDGFLEVLAVAGDEEAAAHDEPGAGCGCRSSSRSSRSPTSGGSCASSPTTACPTTW